MKIAILVSKYTPKRINRNMFSKISSREIPHSKRVSKIMIFYIKMIIFEKKEIQNLIKIHSKTHQIASFQEHGRIMKLAIQVECGVMSNVPLSEC